MEGIPWCSVSDTLVLSGQWGSIQALGDVIISESHTKTDSNVHSAPKSGREGAFQLFDLFSTDTGLSAFSPK